LVNIEKKFLQEIRNNYDFWFEGMELFQNKIGDLESDSSSPLSCNVPALNGSEFARYVEKILSRKKILFRYLGVNIVEIILMIIYHR
jgi:hypothetical protein